MEAMVLTEKEFNLFADAYQFLIRCTLENHGAKADAIRVMGPSEEGGVFSKEFPWDKGNI